MYCVFCGRNDVNEFTKQYSNNVFTTYFIFQIAK